MVQKQLIARGIKDERVLEAMMEVPRHLFVPPERRDQAYADRPVALAHGQTISQPYVVALMTSALKLAGDEKVLEIGTGSGYQSAILGRLASRVISVEVVPGLAESARFRLTELGYDNVEVILGNGSIGYSEGAPYDGIMMTAAAPELPTHLLEQLDAGGRLVGPVGSRYDQLLLYFERRGDDWERQVLGPVIFVLLTGKHGWQV
jgi:protein-L-isoaspartate(D-aspartate) O-methyltransferase